MKCYHSVIITTLSTVGKRGPGAYIQWISKMYARIVASTHPTKKYRGAIKNQIDVPTTHYPPPQCLENVP